MCAVPCKPVQGCLLRSGRCLMACSAHWTTLCGPWADATVLSNATMHDTARLPSHSPDSLLWSMLCVLQHSRVQARP